MKSHRSTAQIGFAVYRPPVMAFKWRHWGRMTGKLVCTIGPDTKLEAEATNQEVEIWGVSVMHLDADFKINKMEVSWDTVCGYEMAVRCGKCRTMGLSWALWTGCCRCGLDPLTSSFKESSGTPSNFFLFACW